MWVPGCAMRQAKPTCRRRTSDSSTCRRTSMRVASMMTPPTKSPSMAVKANAAPTRRVRKRGVGVALRPPHHVRIAARVHQADDALRDVVLGQSRESTTVGHRRADITLEADAADAVGQRAQRGRRTDELQISAPRTARQFEFFEAGAIHVHAQRRSLLPRIAEHVVPRRPKCPGRCTATMIAVQRAVGGRRIRRAGHARMRQSQAVWARGGNL